MKIRKAEAKNNEIRCYISNRKYAYARTKGRNIENGIEEKTEKKEKKEKNNIQLDKVEILSLLLITIVIIMKIVYYSEKILRINKFLAVFVVIFQIFAYTHMLLIVATYMSEKKLTESLKRNHSAEHRMINYLKKFNHLPNSVAELKKASRFSIECGSRELLAKETNFLLRGELWMAFMIVGTIVLHEVTESVVVRYILGAIMYTITYYINKKIYPKFIKRVQDILSIIFQHANTSKKIGCINFELAYWAAWEWLEYHNHL